MIPVSGSLLSICTATSNGDGTFSGPHADALPIEPNPPLAGTIIQHAYWVHPDVGYSIWPEWVETNSDKVVFT